MVLWACYMGQAASGRKATSLTNAPSNGAIAGPILKPLLENILRTTLEDIEESIESVEDAAALSELRRQLAISIAELERCAVTSRCFSVGDSPTRELVRFTR